MGVATPVQTDVVLVHWPEDEGRRQALVAQGVPCLLLVAPESDPPALETNLEDWIRVPADERDLYARIRRLHDLAAPLTDAPTVDEEDLFHHRGRWIGLPASEAALARVLLADFGKLVGRQQLEAQLLSGSEGSRVIDSQVHRLRHRIAPLGFTVTAVRGRGYVLETSPQGE